MEATIAVVLLGFAALAAASAQAWCARVLQSAEAREDAVAAAEAVLDSLAQLPVVQAGTARADGLELQWTVDTVAPLVAVRVRVRAGARAGPLDERFEARLGRPFPSPDTLP